MTHYRRILSIAGDVKKKSLFLFGPRQTGKTFLLKETFPAVPFYNLLLADVFLKLSQRPSLIREELFGKRSGPPALVIIDEIQKLPILLGEVHHLIEEYGCRFILTGSSPCKLKRSGGNLLGGRAWTRHLFPLVTPEVPGFDLMRILNIGAIPSIYDSESPDDDLAAYVGNYLQEEIRAEGLARNVGNFSRFLQASSLANAELVNFNNVANDAGVPPRTVAEYFSILKDTLVGCTLEPFTKTRKRKAISTAKFYFFDVGVCNYLAGRKNIKPKTELFGKVLEHFIFTELKACLAYENDKRPLSFWRSASGYEVDFIVGDDVAIEVKGTAMVTERHLAGLNALSEEIELKRRVVVSMDSAPRRLNGVWILPVEEFLKELWSTGFRR